MKNKDISAMGRKTKILVYKDSEQTTKGENLTQGERYDKGNESIKILSTQVGGATS